jgi:hypothetical protein
MRRDLYGALKNALEKGTPMERAIQSFVNAGYSDIEVREAANQLAPASVNIVKTQTPKSINPQKQMFTPVSIERKKPKQNKPILMIIILSAVLVVLLTGLISTIIFREKLVEYITGLLG